MADMKEKKDTSIEIVELAYGISFDFPKHGLCGSKPFSLLSFFFRASAERFCAVNRRILMFKKPKNELYEGAVGAEMTSY
jgi:hypothetical protein